MCDNQGRIQNSPEKGRRPLGEGRIWFCQISRKPHENKEILVGVGAGAPWSASNTSVETIVNSAFCCLILSQICPTSSLYSDDEDNRAL